MVKCGAIDGVKYFHDKVAAPENHKYAQSCRTQVTTDKVAVRK